jgi:hypothetical protein
VRDLFPEGVCLQDADTAALCRAAYEWNTATPLPERVEAIGEGMAVVARSHTYESRIRTMLDVIDLL